MLDRNIRLNKVLRELNISLERAVDFLKEKGVLIESNPNSKINQNEYEILTDQFSSLKRFSEYTINKENHLSVDNRKKNTFY